MSKLGRAGLALMLVSVLVPLAGVVAGASVSARQQAVSEAKYAKVLCSTYKSLRTSLDDFTAAYNAAPADTPATFQTGVVAATTDFLGNVGKPKMKLAKIYPDVDGGKKIAKIMATDLTAIEQKVSDALAEFVAADPNGVAFTADIAQFEVVLQLLTIDTTDLSKVTDQDVVSAIGDERICKKIFPVTGG